MVAPAVSNVVPTDTQTDHVPIELNLDFDITGADNVDLSTLDVWISNMGVWDSLDPNGAEWWTDICSFGSMLLLVGRLGNVRYSNDSGASWSVGTSNTTEHINGVAANGTIAVAVGENGIIRSTTDGMTWSSVTSPVSSRLRRVYWLGGSFIAIGDSGVILTSTDGTSWTSQTTPTTDYFYSLAYSGTSWVAVGTSGAIVRSTDLVNWTDITSPSTVVFEAIAFGTDLDTSKYIIVGRQADFYVSTDDGLTWSTLTHEFDGDYFKYISFDDVNKFWLVAGRYNSIDISTIAMSQEGFAWTVLPDMMRGLPSSVRFDTTSGKWFSVSAYGTVLRSPEITTLWEQAVTGGSFLSGYQGSSSAITSITGGYNVVVDKESDWESRGAVAFVVSADSLVGGDDMFFIDYFKSEHSGLEIIFADIYRTAYFSLTTSWQTFLTIPSTSITPGDEYMILGTVVCGPGSTDQIALDLLIGGSNFGDTRGQYVPGSGLKEYTFLRRWTAVLGDDVAIRGYSINDASALIANASLMMINLSNLTEGVDFHWNDEGTNEIAPSSFGSELYPATVTFTPPEEGLDYLVFGHVAMLMNVGYQKAVMRVVEGGSNVITQFGYGSSNVGTAHHPYVCMGILQSPSGSTTITTQYRSDGMEKIRASLFVLNLGILQEYAFAYQDIDALPGSAGTDIAAGSVTTNFAQPNIFCIADLKSEAGSTYNGSARGILGRLEYPSSAVGSSVAGSGILYSDEAPYTGYYHTNNANYTGDTGGHVGPMTLGRYFGTIQSEDLDAVIKAASTSSDNKLRRQTILVLAQDFEVPPVPYDMQLSFTLIVAEAMDKTTAFDMMLGFMVEETVDFDVIVTDRPYVVLEPNPRYESDAEAALTFSGVDSAEADVYLEDSGISAGDVLEILNGLNRGHYVIQDVSGSVVRPEASFATPSGEADALFRKSREKAAYLTAAAVISQPAFFTSFGIWCLVDFWVVDGFRLDASFDVLVDGTSQPREVTLFDVNVA